MKIKELILEADKNKFYIDKAGDFAATLRYLGANTPDLCIIALDKQPIKESKDLVLIKPNSAKFKTFRYGQNIGDNKDFTTIYNTVFRIIDNNLHLLEKENDFNLFQENFNKYKQFFESTGIFKVTNFNSATSLVKTLIIKYKIPPELIVKLTGVHFDESVDATTKIGDTEIVFPDNMRASRLEDITHLIKSANEILEKNNLGILTKIKMIVAPINGKTIGLYYVGSKNIKIDPNARATKTAVHTLLHEYGHKWFFEQLTAEKREEIKQKFNECFRNKEIRTFIPADRLQNILNYKKDIANIVSTLKEGDKIDYNGRKIKYKSATPFVVVEATNTKLRLQSSIRPGLVISGPSEAFMLGDFSHNGRVLKIQGTEETGQQPINTGWFPTDYSRTNADEWYAELFAFYLMNQLMDQDVIDFIKSTL